MFTFIAGLFAIVAAIASEKTISKPTVPGAGRNAVKEFTLSNAYTAGGEVLTPKMFGLRRIIRAEAFVVNGGDEAKEAELFIGNPWVTVEAGVIKLHLSNLKTGKELVTGKNTEKITVRVVASGS